MFSNSWRINRRTARRKRGGRASLIAIALLLALPAAGAAPVFTQVVTGACEVAMTPADINRMGFFYPDMQLCPIPGRGNPGKNHI